SIARQRDAIDMEAATMVPWTDAPRLVFNGLQRLLDPQVPVARQRHALERLRRYAGLEPGTQPVTKLAQARFEERMGDAKLLGPLRAEIEQSLANMPTYAKGVRDLFATAKLEGADEALAALDTQFAEYAEWARKVVLPRTRTDPKLPRDYYAYRLRQVGIDIAPEALVARAQLEFMETRSAMQQLAPIVAKEHGIAATDYRDVLRALKKKQLGEAEIVPYYHEIIPQLEQRIRDGRVVDVPKRPMVMRLGSPAENAAQPAPHFQSAPVIGNKGEQGQFVLPLSNPQAAGGKTESYDDFTYEAAAWTLTAHEGRPGHELQFTSMVERGISLARSVFARTSVNTEGWALYAEAEMVPYEPVAGQLVALQFRLLRAARATLDPLLNLGLITRERAREVLVDDVVLSEAMARQELDRYQFRSPGQAGSYFYGYSRILELRMETELALGAKFDRYAYNNFLLQQGMLPPDLLAKAVREQFVPAQR
ncbi:MAG TPA: DUF885 domain-containing protein, partial [Xanthomonadales bacterium]|nr:DUF885 domain-containing protein [Xanthomonadales bacterium]